MFTCCMARKSYCNTKCSSQFKVYDTKLSSLALSNFCYLNACSGKFTQKLRNEKKTFQGIVIESVKNENTNLK